MNQLLFDIALEPPETPPIIQHVLCTCGRMGPLADGLVRFDVEEADEGATDYWQCQSCFHSVESRAILNVFGITGVQRIKATADRIRAAKIQRRWDARKQLNGRTK